METNPPCPGWAREERKKGHSWDEMKRRQGKWRGVKERKRRRHEREEH